MQGSTPIFVAGPDLFWTTTSGALQFHQILLFVVYFGIQSRVGLYSFVGPIQPRSHRLKSQHFFKNISFKRTWRHLKLNLTPSPPSFCSPTSVFRVGLWLFRTDPFGAAHEGRMSCSTLFCSAPPDEYRCDVSDSRDGYSDSCYCCCHCWWISNVTVGGGK